MFDRRSFSKDLNNQLESCYTVEPLLSGPRLSGHLSYPDDKPDAKN